MQDFFDKLAMYQHQGRIDEDTVYKSYSYWIERYWLAAEVSIQEFRKLEHAPDYYGDFEALFKEMLAHDVRQSGEAASLVGPSKAELQRFL